METKVCSNCNIEQPIQEYYKRSDVKYKDVYYNYCKGCTSIVRARYKSQNKEKIAKYNKEWYDKTRVERNAHRREYLKNNRHVSRANIKRVQERLRETIVDGYGGVCSCCGESELKFLDIDHINNNGKSDRTKFNSYRTFYRWLRDNGFPKEEYQLLCSNCNQGKRRNGGVCPHKVSV